MHLSKPIFQKKKKWPGGQPAHLLYYGEKSLVLNELNNVGIGIVDKSGVVAGGHGLHSGGRLSAFGDGRKDVVVYNGADFIAVISVLSLICYSCASCSEISDRLISVSVHIQLITMSHITCIFISGIT